MDGSRPSDARATRRPGAGDLRIEAVGASRSELVRFWRAGLAPYEGDPNFVVPLLMDCLVRWDRKGAFFRHAESQHFIAVRGGRDVGRIAATVDRVQDEFHGDRTGLFGWFETENDPATAHGLLDAAAAWLVERGRDRIRGPLSYTTNGISGLLVRDGRPGPPVVDMAYNPPWYQEHLAAWGLAKARDLVALWADMPAEPDPRITRIAHRVLERGRYTLRPIRTERAGFDADVSHIQDIYNTAWERNWGFVPLTPEEIREQAEQFRPILVPDLLLLAERDGQVVAFSLTLPDVNYALHGIRGRLWPWSIVTLLRRKRRIKTTRTLTLGVVPEHRGTGLDAALIYETTVRAARLGIRGGECSWMLEDNVAMIRPIEQLGGREYRRYRVFERELKR